MATSFPFPASPTVGQEVTLSDGVTIMAWDGSAWEAKPIGSPYLPLAGGTLTGDLYLRKGTGAGDQISIHGIRGANLGRWRMDIGSGEVESGGNAGSNFRILRFNDAGTFIDVPLFVARGTGFVHVGAGNVLSVDGGRIAFPPVQIPSVNVNTLDDYEEGTWMPTNAAGVGMTINEASYTKIGRMVHVQANLFFATNSNSGNMTIGGLPFPIVVSGPMAIGYSSAVLPGEPTALAQPGVGINLYSGIGFATFTQYSNAGVYFGGWYTTTT